MDSSSWSTTTAELGPAGRLVFALETLAWSVLLVVVLAAKDVRVARGAIERMTGGARRLTEDHRAAVVVALRADRVCRAVRLKSCLLRSLATWAMLRRRGLAAEIFFGVQPSGRRLEGHAWLETTSGPLIRGAASGFAPFDRPVTS